MPQLSKHSQQLTLDATMPAVDTALAMVASVSASTTGAWVSPWTMEIALIASVHLSLLGSTHLTSWAAVTSMLSALTEAFVIALLGNVSASRDMRVRRAQEPPALMTVPVMETAIISRTWATWPWLTITDT